MTVLDQNESQLRDYYQKTLSGDGVCTITEDEFVAESQHFKNEGRQLALREFTGMPSTVDIDRSFTISDAQKLGQKTYQTVIILGRGSL